MKKKIVVFGAGKIGRSFIGQVFSRSGYEVVFVDIFDKLIEQLNQSKQYNVVIKEDGKDTVITITGIRGICLTDADKVVAELADAELASLSVGQQGMAAALPIIAKGLEARRAKIGDIPLDIIIAENMRNADEYISKELVKLLPNDYPANKLVGLVETSIGKMVPIMAQKDIEADPLQVFAEPYNSLIVAKKGFKNPIPNVPYLAPKENIKAWVDRKLFIHNLGHAATAYLGYKAHADKRYIYEVLYDGEVYNAVRSTMLQAADILIAVYPGEFTKQQLEEHIDDLLSRFGNKSLGDTVFRVGCDLYRKLSPEDRLVAPINAAIKRNKPYELILDAVVAGIYFRATDEKGKYFPNDIGFFEEAENGTDYILQNVCKLNTDKIKTKYL